jgi:dimethylargininase
MFKQAIVRVPGETFARGITTAVCKEPDLDRMRIQHADYVDKLRSIGLKIIVLPPQRQFPDGHFVEDTAVVTSQVAVIANPGAESRRGEAASIADALAPFRDIERIHPPGTLDGGDVLMAGDHFFVGISERTNEEGASQLCRILQRCGHTCSKVPVADGLHLKSSVNWLGGDTLILAGAFAGHNGFDGYRKILVPPEELPACNTLWVNGNLLVPAGFPRTTEKISGLGMPVTVLDMSESQKMDGGLTCLSIRF